MGKNSTKDETGSIKDGVLGTGGEADMSGIGLADLKQYRKEIRAARKAEYDVGKSLGMRDEELAEELVEFDLTASLLSEVIRLRKREKTVLTRFRSEVDWWVDRDNPPYTQGKYDQARFVLAYVLTQGFGEAETP